MKQLFRPPFSTPLKTNRTVRASCPSRVPCTQQRRASTTRPVRPLVCCCAKAASGDVVVVCLRRMPVGSGRLLEYGLQFYDAANNELRAVVPPQLLWADDVAYRRQHVSQPRDSGSALDAPLSQRCERPQSGAPQPHSQQLLNANGSNEHSQQPNGRRTRQGPRLRESINIVQSIAIELTFAIFFPQIYDPSGSLPVTSGGSPMAPSQQHQQQWTGQATGTTSPHYSNANLYGLVSGVPGHR